MDDYTECTKIYQKSELGVEVAGIKRNTPDTPLKEL